jgi:hypothetical protein
MISDVVTNGLLSLPNAMAVVGEVANVSGVVRVVSSCNFHFYLGIVPGLVLTIFLGIFALFTSKLLIDFKLNHPNVHSMGRNHYV